MTVVYPRALASGDCGVIIEFGDVIREDVNARVLALDRALAANAPIGMLEAVPTYRSLLIHYDPLATDFEQISATALALAERAGNVFVGRRLKVPVCYEGEFAPDLLDVAATLKMSADEVIERHSNCVYRVYMLGFQPGFAYLGGLDQRLCLPRRARVRHGALAGTISIAAAQCAIHAVDGPSGWHWIGRTPARTNAMGDAKGFTIKPGDVVSFVPIRESEWHELRRAALHGENVIEVIPDASRQCD